jgi:uncharacterized protein
MKIFAIADLHGDGKYIDLAADLIRKADLVVISGDISRSGKIVSAERMIESIEKYNKNILAVHGNWDRSEVLDLIEEKGYGIHNSGRTIKGIGFFGVGGSNPTPMKTSSEYSEDEILDFLKAGYLSVKKANTTVLVSHTPPFNTRDRTFLGLHGGSQAVRDFIVEHGISLCLCGHIHEANGTAQLEKCTVVNPGSFKKGKYCLIEMAKDGQPEVQHGKIKRPVFSRIFKHR